MASIKSFNNILTLASFDCNVESAESAESAESNEDIESLPILPDDILYGKIFPLLDFDQLAQCASLNKKMNELLQKKKNLIPSVSPNDNLMKAILNSNDGKLRLLPGQHKLEIDSNICIPKLYLFGSYSNVNKTSILLDFNNKILRMKRNTIKLNINKLVIDSIIIETLSESNYSLIISNYLKIDHGRLLSLYAYRKLLYFKKKLFGPSYFPKKYIFNNCVFNKNICIQLMSNSE